MYPHLDKESLRLIEQSNRVGIDFLLTDLNTGLTFLQIAYVTSSPTSRSRSLDKAYEVYRTVIRLLPRVVLTPDLRLEIEKKLEDLRSQLEKEGYSCMGLS